MIGRHELLCFGEWPDLESKDGAHDGPYDHEAHYEMFPLKHEAIPFGSEEEFDFGVLLLFAFLLEHFNFIRVFIAAAEYSSAVQRALSVYSFFINNGCSREECHDEDIVHRNNYSSKYAK